MKYLILFILVATTFVAAIPSHLASIAAILQRRGNLPQEDSTSTTPSTKTDVFSEPELYYNNYDAYLLQEELHRMASQQENDSPQQ